jgi:DNA primase
LDVVSLKEYIYKENKIEYILEQIGCHSIKYHPNKEYFSCGNISNKDGDGDNINAINIKNNMYLNCVNYTRKKHFDDKSDLITLIQYNKDLSFKKAMRYTHNLLGLQFTYKKEEEKKKDVFDPLAVFKKVKKYRKQNNVSDIEVLDDEILEDYTPCIHVNWVKEGITQYTVNKFQLGYSFRRQRVIIPVRYWLTGELIGITGRTMVENYDEFDIPKYFAIKPYTKTINLYGLYENYETIEKAGYAIIWESEKSVLKRHSLLDGTGVAVGCHDISDEQVRILLGLNISEIIISFDKGIDIDYIRHCCEKFYHLRKVSYIYDKWDLLEDKEAPADKPNKIYEFLFKYRTVYDEFEHKEYLKSLERKIK